MWAHNCSACTARPVLHGHVWLVTLYLKYCPCSPFPQYTGCTPNIVGRSSKKGHRFTLSFRFLLFSHLFSFIHKRSFTLYSYLCSLMLSSLFYPSTNGFVSRPKEDLTFFQLNFPFFQPYSQFYVIKGKGICFRRDLFLIAAFSLFSPTYEEKISHIVLLHSVQSPTV